MFTKISWFKLIMIIAIGFFIPNIIYAKKDISPKSFISNVYINKATIDKGFTHVSTDNKFFLGLTPGVLNNEAKVTLKNFWPTKRIKSSEFGKLNLVDNRFLPKEFAGEFPFGYEVVGDIYEFDIHNGSKLYNPKRPLWLKIKNVLPSDDRWKGFFYFDKGKQEWIEIPSSYDEKENVFKSAIHLPYAMVAILTMSKEYGIASWYAYKKCDCAASIDYPKKTKLLVTNLRNNKSIVVTVNDYGPERWTKRIIDLDKTVFKKIDKLSMGLTRVKVQLLELAPGQLPPKL